MRLIHAHATDLIIIVVDDCDPIWLLEQLHSQIPENVWDGFGPTLVARFCEATPLNSNSPYFLTVSAAQGFKMDNRRRRACGV
jgi:hypothetical protein